MADTYGATAISRTSVPVANVWTAVLLPVGGRGCIIMLEDASIKWRFSPDNTLNPVTEGLPIPANGAVFYEGTATDTMTVYVSATVGGSFADVLLTKDS